MLPGPSGTGMSMIDAPLRQFPLPDLPAMGWSPLRTFLPALPPRRTAGEVWMPPRTGAGGRAGRLTHGDRGRRRRDVSLRPRWAFDRHRTRSPLPLRYNDPYRAFSWPRSASRSRRSSACRLAGGASPHAHTADPPRPSFCLGDKLRRLRDGCRRAGLLAAARTRSSRAPGLRVVSRHDVTGGARSLAETRSAEGQARGGSGRDDLPGTTRNSDASLASFPQRGRSPLDRRATACRISHRDAELSGGEQSGRARRDACRAGSGGAFPSWSE